MFFVVAPKTKQTDSDEMCDLASWRSRGWCRLEEWANTLSLNAKCPVIVTENNVVVQGWEDHCVLIGSTKQSAVACGNFTCCQVGHKVDDGQGVQEIQCDIVACVQILRTMWRVKLAYAREKKLKILERSLVMYRQ